MTHKTFIYALTDLDGSVRYIGASGQPKARLYTHKSAARRAPEKAFSQWLLNYPVEIRVLSTVAVEDAGNEERRWIAHYKPSGMLFNIYRGGEGLSIRQNQTCRSDIVHIRFDLPASYRDDLRLMALETGRAMSLFTRDFLGKLIDDWRIKKGG